MEVKESFIISGGIFEDIFDVVCEPANNTLPEPDFFAADSPERSFESLNPQLLSEYNFDEKDHNLRLYQFKTEKQRTRLACGYNTLFNGYVVVKVLTNGEPRSFFEMIRNKTQFWYHSRFLNMRLLKEQEKYGKYRDCYPWSRKNIKNFIIERCYMEFLVKDSPTFHTIPDVSRKLLENCFLTPDALKAINNKFLSFLEGDKKVNVFCMGALNHWFCLIVNRYEKERVEAIIADSRNWTFFGLNEQELREYIRGRIDKFYKYFPKNYHIKKEEMVDTYTTSMQQALDSVLLVVDCCTGKRNFITEALDCGIEGCLKQYVLAKHDIYMFMENFFHPVQIRQGLLKTFETFKSNLPDCKNLGSFRAWIRMAKEDMSNSEEKLPKYDFRSPTLTHDCNDELIWEYMVRKEMERVKNGEPEKVPLTPNDLENRTRMIKVLDEFLVIMNSLDEGEGEGED